jgi:hypothetical protein
MRPTPQSLTKFPHSGKHFTLLKMVRPVSNKSAARKEFTQLLEIDPTNN